jgi:hypothetical protein
MQNKMALPTGVCVDAGGGMHGGLTVGRLARESLCSVITIVIIIQPK